MHNACPARGGLELRRAMSPKSSRAKAPAAPDLADEDARKRRREKASTNIERDDLEDIPKRAKKTGIDLVDLVVSKCLRDNFKMWGEELTDLNLVDGLSLRARIKKDKLAAASGQKEGSMGKLYYAELRSMCGSANDPLADLDIQNEEDPEDQTMMSRLEKLFARKKTFDSIIEWLDSANMVNQKTSLA